MRPSGDRDQALPRLPLLVVVGVFLRVRINNVEIVQDAYGAAGSADARRLRRRSKRAARATPSLRVRSAASALDAAAASCRTWYSVSRFGSRPVGFR